MIVKLTRGAIYFFILVLLQVLCLNNIHFLRVATPFVYLYFILKMPVGTQPIYVVLSSFLIGFVIDLFSNTPGMHAAATTLIGVLWQSIIHRFIDDETPNGIYPSYEAFGVGKFLYFTFIFALIHHVLLFWIESLTLYDPMFLLLRIVSSILTTVLLIGILEAFNKKKLGSGN